MGYDGIEFKQQGDPVHHEQVRPHVFVELGHPGQVQEAAGAEAHLVLSRGAFDIGVRNHMRELGGESDDPVVVFRRGQHDPFKAHGLRQGDDRFYCFLIGSIYRRNDKARVFKQVRQRIVITGKFTPGHRMGPDLSLIHILYDDDIDHDMDDVDDDMLDDDTNDDVVNDSETPGVDEPVIDDPSGDESSDADVPSDDDVIFDEVEDEVNSRPDNNQSNQPDESDTEVKAPVKQNYTLLYIAIGSGFAVLIALLGLLVALVVRKKRNEE